MDLKTFFQGNTWASQLTLGIIITLVAIFMFFKTKNTLDALAAKNPEADFFGNTFGKTWGRIIPFLLFISCILLSWFLTTL
ncbi:hypothetical protein [Tenacibaculum maritimum]|uniref:hypothetical protein n=1 Tax=Tenacibaculum maritimum TaxID=107401 RepID=UPI003876BC50